MKLKNKECANILIVLIIILIIICAYMLYNKYSVIKYQQNISQNKISIDECYNHAKSGDILLLLSAEPIGAIDYTLGEPYSHVGLIVEFNNDNNIKNKFIVENTYSKYPDNFNKLNLLYGNNNQRLYGNNQKLEDNNFPHLIMIELKQYLEIKLKEKYIIDFVKKDNPLTDTQYNNLLRAIISANNAPYVHPLDAPFVQKNKIVLTNGLYQQSRKFLGKQKFKYSWTNPENKYQFCSTTIFAILISSGIIANIDPNNCKNTLCIYTDMTLPSDILNLREYENAQIFRVNLEYI